ncbi:hypothetical protein TWF281_007015 [Arthrobotrys megalospora]
MPPGFPDIGVDAWGEVDFAEEEGWSCGAPHRIGGPEPRLTITSNNSNFRVSNEALRDHSRHEGRPIRPTSSAIPIEIDLLEDRPDPDGPLHDKRGTIIIYERAQWKFYGIEESDRYRYIYEFRWHSGQMPESRSVWLSEATVTESLRPKPWYNTRRTLNFRDGGGYRWTMIKAEFRADDDYPEWYYSLIPLGDRNNSRAIWKRQSGLTTQYGWVQLAS